MSHKDQVNFKAGMYLLETLTAGMYNEPLAIYREYIQNSVDSIDLVPNTRFNDFQVNIELDPFEKKITISDNGSGLSTGIAEEVLCTLGSSNKRNSNLRGFRGIGRLGGIAFSDTAIFRTKAQGETIESIQEWDCKKLRKYLADPKKSKLSLVQVIQEISKFKKTNSKGSEGSYFSVTLEGVTSFRNYIFDIQKVRRYLRQIAPIKFNRNEFKYGDEINEWLSNNLDNYGVYNIILNGTSIYKPYSTEIQTNKHRSDELIGIKKIDLKIKNEVIAYGWYGIRKSFLGGITKGEGASGIRVRVGNILIGDSHLLDGCFREDRFNSYVVGEIHVDTPLLIPNSRRDDFVDNDYKTLFYNAVEREIGLPLSKEIRKASREHVPSNPKIVPTMGKDFNQVFRKEFKIPSRLTDSMILSEVYKEFKGSKKFIKLLSNFKA